MLEDASLRKMKALLATSNRLPPWSSVVNQYSQEQVSLYSSKRQILKLQIPGFGAEIPHRHLSQLHLWRRACSAA